MVTGVSRPLGAAAGVQRMVAGALSRSVSFTEPSRRVCLRPPTTTSTVKPRAHGRTRWAFVLEGEEKEAPKGNREHHVTHRRKDGSHAREHVPIPGEHLFEPHARTLPPEES